MKVRNVSEVTWATEYYRTNHMSDDQAPSDLPTEASPHAETRQLPVSDGLPSTPAEPVPEPTPPANEAAEVAAKPQNEPSESEPKPINSGAAAAASTQSTTTIKTPEHDRELLKIARAKIQTRKQEDLEKIMRLFAKKENITNDDVEKGLKCSDSSAFRYLRELVRQGKIKRVGKTGASVEYIKA